MFADGIGRRSLAVVSAIVAAGTLIGCGGGSSHRPTRGARPGARRDPSYYARRQIAVGRLPNGQGFGIWVQRYRFRGKPYVQLIESVAPPARAMSRIRRELASGLDGSSEQNIDDMTVPVRLNGLVGCGHPPVVLLTGLIRTAVHTAYLQSRTGLTPVRLAALPADLGVRGVIAYAALRKASTLRLIAASGRVIYTMELLAPPEHRECAGGNDALIYVPGWSS